MTIMRFGRRRMLPAAPELENKERSLQLAAYEMILLRQLDQDQMQWQTPGLALTAQAFLLTIAIGAGTSQFARLMASGLGVVVAGLSMQLMAKHRWLEQLDAIQLQALERALGLPEISVRGWGFGDVKPTGSWRRRVQREYLLTSPKTSWVRRTRSYVLWQLGLGLFAAVNVTVAFITVLRPSLWRQ
jgi:hypothetical protein